MKARRYCPLTFAEEIEKAVRYIKVNQFKSGFTEILYPERGGDIEVLIEPDEEDTNIFHILFSFITLPTRQIIIKEYKRITYNELRRLAAEYDKVKEDVDKELKSRHFLRAVR